MSNYPDGAYYKLSALWDNESKMEKAVERASEKIICEIIDDPSDMADQSEMSEEDVSAWANIAYSNIDSAMIAMPEVHRKCYPVFYKWVEDRSSKEFYEHD